MIRVTNDIALGENEIQEQFIRSSGPGGQNVNKLATAVHLRFDIHGSSLPDFYKERLVKLQDQRITKEGVIVIKAQQYRSREKNKEEALGRLQQLIQGVAMSRKRRKPTRPTYGSQKRRLDRKTKRGQTKTLRGKITV